jgi:carbonic anhydrase
MQCDRTKPGLESSSLRDCISHVANEDASRRKFLQMTLGGTLAGLATEAGMELVTPRTTVAQTTLSLDAALGILKQHTIEKQEPFAAVLSCADSRVPVRASFRSDYRSYLCYACRRQYRHFGDYREFGIWRRRVGNSGDGTRRLRRSQGYHSGKRGSGQISALYPHIQPAVDQVGPNLEAATKANAKLQADLLREASTVTASLVKAGKLKVTAAYYDIGAGTLSLLD